MKLEGSRPEIDGQTMKKNLLPIDYLPEKYGCKVRPYELSLKLKQGGDNKIEYFYSLKSFEKETTVSEREPFRLLDIQDPFTYRGELSFNKSSVQTSSKVFIVNGKIEKVDDNFAGGFYFNKIKKCSIMVGSCPLTAGDINKIKGAGATAVFNIQTGPDMEARGFDWHQIKDKYRALGILPFSYPINDSSEDGYTDGLFHASQHLNDLVNEQGHTVYLHDNTGISRAPTLLLSYLCLYARIRTYENLPEASKLITTQCNTAVPNLKIITKLLKRCKAFQQKQIAMLGEIDEEDEDKFLTEITPNYYGEDRQSPVRVYMRDMQA